MTPLSNHGEFTSFPAPNIFNPLASPAEIGKIDAVAATRNRGRVVDIPSGIGFCLYVTRACLDAVELLSEDFHRGYLEDVDFCLRAREHGFRSVCATSVYVGHAGSRSFGQEKRALVVRNLRVLERRFPSHRPECAAFMFADPLRTARQSIERALAPTARRDPAGHRSGRRRRGRPGARRAACVAGTVGDNRRGAARRRRNESEGLRSGRRAAAVDPVRPVVAARARRADRLSQRLAARADGNSRSRRPAGLPDAPAAGDRGAARPVHRRREPARSPRRWFGDDCHAVRRCADGAPAGGKSPTRRDVFARRATRLRRSPRPSCQSGKSCASTLREAPGARRPVRWPGDALRLAIIPVRSCAGEQRQIVEIARAFREHRSDVSIVVIGATLDDLALMRLGNVFVTGTYEAAEFERLIRANRIGALFVNLSRPLFGHPVVAKALSARLPAAYRDLVGGRPRTASGRSGDRGARKSPRCRRRARQMAVRPVTLPFKPRARPSFVGARLRTAFRRVGLSDVFGLRRG